MFNTDESGVFFKWLPDKTLTFKKCEDVDENLSDDEVTPSVLISASNKKM